MSGIIPAVEFGDLRNAHLSLTVNDRLPQQGNTCDVIMPNLPLIAYMSRFFMLRAGDNVLTGTPQGVGSIVSGDVLKVTPNSKSLTTHVI